MKALGIVYSQYRLQPNDDNLYEAHFLKACHFLKLLLPREEKVGEMYSPSMLDMATLNHNAWLFKGATKANDVDTMPITMNPLMQL